ncbi:MAG: hypothetical protein LC803_16595 [Acidobacteria bacterium]|nr:hypothetical protein [Acidobacteriota bacterium]
MDLILKPSGGANIVLRPQGRATYYPPAEVDPVEVEIWRRELDADGKFTGDAVSLGRFPSVGRIEIENTPDTDRNIRYYAISYAADGTPDVSSLEDAVQVTLLVKRETAAPNIGQVGDATADSVTVGVSGYTRFARKRRVKIAESLDGGGALVDPIVAVSDAGGGQLGDYVEIARASTFTPAFAYLDGDPAAAGFTKTGTAPAEAGAGGWRINSAGTDAATYYTLDSFPADAFDEGFTLELDPPAVAATDAAGPAQCVALRVEDGARAYELAFDADEVKLNGGGAHAHGDMKVRLVVAAGGLTADLWIGDTLVEDNTAGAATTGEGLSFGDLAMADDADAVWKRIAYALTPVPTKLSRTIYVTVAHSSGGAYGAESDVLELTFASEGETQNGSTGDFDPTPRFKVDYEELV